MKHKLIISLLFAFVFSGVTQLQAQEYDEHDKEQVRKFLRQDNNFSKLQLTPNDTITWYESEEWVQKISNGSNKVTWSSGSPRQMEGFSLSLPDPKNRFTGFLDLSGCQQLRDIFINGTRISGIDLSALPKLTMLYIGFSSLTFETLPVPKILKEQSPYIQINYSYLTDIKIPENIAIGSSVDLRSSGGATFEWFTTNSIGTKTMLLKGFHYKEDNGVFTFLKEQKGLISCQITHDDFPYTTLTTTRMAVTESIVPKDNYNEHDKEVARNFVRTIKNLELIGFEPTDTLNWNTTTDWIHKTPCWEWNIHNSEYHLYKILIPYISKKETMSFDFSNCQALEHVGTSSIPDKKSLTIIEDINLTNCSNLVKIDLFFPYLKNINLTDCYNLEELQLLKLPSTEDELILDHIDLSTCQRLRNLTIQNTKIEEIDLSKLNNLENVYLSKNKLKSIILGNQNPENFKIHSIDQNNLTFSSLSRIKDYITSNFTRYDKQAKVEIPERYVDIIDLSDSGGTLFSWYKIKENEEQELIESKDYTIEKGVTTFTGHPESIYCKITNPDFPKLTLYTTVSRLYIHSIDYSTLDELVKVYSSQAGEIKIEASIDAQYSVCTLSGNIIAKGIVDATIIKTNVASGIYLVKIETGEGSTTQKVIVK